MQTRLFLALLATGCASFFPAAAQQQVTGTLGAPSATSTINGQSLPAEAPAVRRGHQPRRPRVTPWWPPTVVPPKGAPNVLLIMTDDAGYGVSGTFGGVIPTPTLDALAADGLRYTQFHSTALCSPTRAALITGRNHHSAGFGVIAEQATGFPGYDFDHRPRTTPRSATSSRTTATPPRGSARTTTPRPMRSPTSGPFDQWPSGMGFDYFYGFMGGESDQWTPWLFRDHTQIFPWNDNPDYNMITGMADDAINYLREVDAAAPDKPFFMYYVPGATHAPHQPTQEWIDKFKGKFDMGWNAMRDEIFANQKRLGVIPENTQLTPWPDDLPQWDTLDADSKKMFARQAEVFAAYVAYADHEIGRVIDEVRRQGKLDNTLVIYIEGDNGTSAEGSTIGTAFDLAAIQAINMPVAGPAEILRRLGRADDPAAHVGGLVLGLRHAVQVDQADRLALRRHPAGHGDVLARPHHRPGRRPQPVPPRHRHRADDPRGHRHRGAADGRTASPRSRSRASAWPIPGLKGPRTCPRSARPSISRCSAIARSTMTAGSPRPRRRPGRG